MPTTKQKALARELLNAAVMDAPPTAGSMLEKVGYSANLVKQPGRVIDSPGVKDALAEYGLTEELITTALVSDIKEKPKNRLGELRLGAELLGKLDNKPDSNKTLILMVTGETAQRYALSARNAEDNSPGPA